MSLARSVSALALAAGASLVSSSARAQNDPRYFTQIRAELQAMGVEAQCAAAGTQAGSCRATTAGISGSPNAPSARRFVLGLDYSDVTDTIYVYVDHYATLPGENASAPALFRRMAEINWETLAARFEWSAESGEVRLSSVMHTDSNFDRRAFRGVVRSLLRVADRYADDIARITGGTVGVSAPTTPTTAAPTAPATGGATLAPMPAPAAR